MSALVVIGIADCQASSDASATMVTYALGSCIAVTVYDPVAQAGAMLHYMLPDSTIDPDKASRNPCVFADTGISRLFALCCDIGLLRSRAVVCVAGGAQILDANGVFNIGKRNYLALRKLFWKAGILVHAEEIGGDISRTVRMELATGRTWVQGSGGEERSLDSGMRTARGRH